MFAIQQLSNIARRTASTVFLSTSATAKPFRILGVQQIAIGCEEKSPLDALWKDIFGLTASDNKVLEKENVDEDIVKLGPLGYEVEIDLMTPLDPNKSPKVGGCYFVSIEILKNLFLTKSDMFAKIQSTKGSCPTVESYWSLGR